MPYRLIKDGKYPGTNLNVYHVFDAEEYDSKGPMPRPIGEVWQTGVKGVTGTWVPTGIRWQLSNSGILEASQEYPVGSLASAVTDMVHEYESHLTAP